MPNRIDLTDSTLDVMVKLTEGNPGAISVLSRWLRDGPVIDPDACAPVIQMCWLDDADIVGADIWLLFKDVCDEDLRVFVAVLRARQFGLVAGRDVKAAIAAGRRHVLNVPDLVRRIEERLPNFQRSESPQSADAVDPVAMNQHELTTRD